jgi:hypothetical protein
MPRNVAIARVSIDRVGALDEAHRAQAAEMRARHRFGYADPMRDLPGAHRRSVLLLEAAEGDEDTAAHGLAEGRHAAHGAIPLCRRVPRPTVSRRATARDRAPARSATPVLNRCRDVALTVAIVPSDTVFLRTITVHFSPCSVSLPSVVTDLKSLSRKGVRVRVPLLASQSEKWVIIDPPAWGVLPGFSVGLLRQT